MSDGANADRTKARSGIEVLLALVGCYLVGGAIYSAFTGAWFPGFPIQFDALAAIVGGGALGAYIEAGVAGLLGVTLLAAVVALVRKERLRPGESK